jgi:hypothetical protein
MRGVLTVVFVVVLALAGVAVASDLGDAGGVSYRLDHHRFDPGEHSHAEAACPKGKHVAGGGFVIASPNSPGTYPVNDSFPVDRGDGDRRPDDGWRVTGTDYPAEVVADSEAMCTDGDYRYRAKSKPVDPGYPPGVKASCGGKHWHVVGGGASLTGTADNQLTSNGPFDGGDADKAPDDGWKALAYIDALDVKLKAYAVCRRAEPSYRKDHRLLDPMEGASVDAACHQGEHVLAAGIDLDGARDGSTIRAAYPQDGTDPHDVPDDGSYAFGTDTSATVSHRLTGYAICTG